MKPSDPKETAAFLDLIRAEGCRSYLEIGSKFGASLGAVASVLQEPSKIVAVDLYKPGMASGEALNELIARLSEDRDARVVLGDSTDPRTVRKVAQSAPFDLVFIDANHTKRYVEADWLNYGPMGRMVAFHDISARSETLEVADLWDRLKQEHRHVEFRFDPTGTRNGIGVLWH